MAGKTGHAILANAHTILHARSSSQAAPFCSAVGMSFYLDYHQNEEELSLGRVVPEPDRGDDILPSRREHRSAILREHSPMQEPELRDFCPLRAEYAVCCPLKKNMQQQQGRGCDLVSRVLV